MLFYQTWKKFELQRLTSVYIFMLKNKVLNAPWGITIPVRFSEVKYRCPIKDPTSQSDLSFFFASNSSNDRATKNISKRRFSLIDILRLFLFCKATFS